MSFEPVSINPEAAGRVADFLEREGQWIDKEVSVYDIPVGKTRFDMGTVIYGPTKTCGTVCCIAGACLIVSGLPKTCGTYEAGHFLGLDPRLRDPMFIPIDQFPGRSLISWSTKRRQAAAVLRGLVDKTVGVDATGRFGYVEADEAAA